MLKHLAALLRDERGATTTVENIGWTILIMGAVAIVGYGLTTLLKGRTGDLIGDIKTMGAVQDEIPIDGSNAYTYPTDMKPGTTGILMVPSGSSN